MLWIGLGPLLLLALYALIYTVVFRVRVEGYTQIQYIIHVFSGLILFLSFSQALSASAMALIKDKKLLFGNFPTHFIPIKAVASGYIVIIPSTVLVILGVIIFSSPHWTLLLLPVVLLFQIIFSIGIGFMLSLLTLVLRDINMLLQYIVIALLVATPIAYTPDMIPEAMKPLLYINPLYYYVTAAQYLILEGRIPPLDIVIVGVGLALLFFGVGYWLFRRAHTVLMDLL